jgi:parvulin-like peptidyl-prolyl isomerase
VGRYAVDYARAVFDLKESKDISPVVHTEFGYHVIYFAERIEPLRVPLEERRQRLADEIWSRRALQLHEQLLQEFRERTPITIERSAMAHTEKVRVLP